MKLETLDGTEDLVIPPGTQPGPRVRAPSAGRSAPPGPRPRRPDRPGACRRADEAERRRDRPARGPSPKVAGRRSGTARKGCSRGSSRRSPDVTDGASPTATVAGAARRRPSGRARPRADHLADDVEHHLRRVLRLRDGESVVVTDGARSLADDRRSGVGVVADARSRSASVVDEDRHRSRSRSRRRSRRAIGSTGSSRRPSSSASVDSCCSTPNGRRSGGRRIAPSSNSTVSGGSPTRARARVGGSGARDRRTRSSRRRAADAAVAEPGAARRVAGEPMIAIGPEGGWTRRELARAPRRVGLGAKRPACGDGGRRCDHAPSDQVTVRGGLRVAMACRFVLAQARAGKHMPQLRTQQGGPTHDIFRRRRTLGVQPAGR